MLIVKARAKNLILEYELQFRKSEIPSFRDKRQQFSLPLCQIVLDNTIYTYIPFLS